MDRNRQRAYKARGLSAEDRRFRKHEEEHDRRRTKRHDALNARRNRVPKTPPKRHIATRSTTQDDLEKKEKSMRERLAEFKKRKELKKRQEGMEKAKKKPFVLVSKTNTIPERLEPVKKMGFTSATVDSRRQAISLRNKPAMPAPVSVRKVAPKSSSQSTSSSKKATAPVTQKEQKQIKTTATETKQKLATPKSKTGSSFEFGKGFSPFVFAFAAPPLPSAASPVKELETVTETETETKKETEEESPTSKHAGVNHFRQIVRKKADQIDVACATWSNYLETDIPEQGCEMIRAAVGKSQLLLRKKFTFFEKLCDDAENVDIDKEVTLDDLQGYWDMIEGQIEDIDKQFAKIQKTQLNGWEREMTPVRRKKIKKTRKKTPCPIRRSTRLHSRLLSAKKKMLAMKEEASSGGVVIFAQKAHTDDSPAAAAAEVAPMPVENDLKTPPPPALSSDDDDEGRTPPPLKWPSSTKSKSKRRSQRQLIIRQKLLEKTPLSLKFERARLSLQSSTSKKRLSRSHKKKSSTAKQRVLFDEDEQTMDATSPIDEDQPAVLPQSYLMPTSSSGTGGNIEPDSLEEEEEEENGIGSLVNVMEEFKFCSDNRRRTRRSNLMCFTPRRQSRRTTRANSEFKSSDSS